MRTRFARLHAEVRLAGSGFPLSVAGPILPEAGIRSRLPAVRDDRRLRGLEENSTGARGSPHPDRGPRPPEFARKAVIGDQDG